MSKIIGNCMHAFCSFLIPSKVFVSTLREEEGQQLGVCFCLSCSTTRFYHDWLAGSGHKATLHFSSTGSTVFLNLAPPPFFKSCSRHRKNVFRESGIKAKFWLWIKKEEKSHHHLRNCAVLFASQHWDRIEVGSTRTEVAERKKKKTWNGKKAREADK